MIRLAVFLFSFAGWFLFLAAFTSWPGAALPLFIFSSSIAVLYVFSLAGVLLPGAYGLAAAGLVLGLAVVFRSATRRKACFSKLLEPGPVLFFLLAALLWPALSKTHYAMWDEFSHWGFATKEMVLRNALPSLDSALHFKDYPPGTALFQYEVTVFTGWSEGATLFAQALLLLAAAVALLQTIAWNRAIRLATVLSLSYLFLRLFNYKLQSLYVDPVLGFLFGIAIASSLLSDDGKPGTLLRILPTLLILPLVKASGLLLALTAAAAIVTNHLIVSLPLGGRIKRLGSLGLCAVVLLAPLIASTSWTRRVSDLGIARSFDTTVTLATIRKSFSAAASDTQRAIRSNFTRALSSGTAGKTLPPAPLFLILLLAAFAAFRKEKRRAENLQIRATTLWMASGFVVYTFGLLLLYLFTFSSQEGLGLASFERYMGVYLLAWSVVTLAFFLRLPPSPGKAGYARYAGLLIIVSAAMLLMFSPLEKGMGKRARLLRKAVQEKAHYAISKTADNARIYIVWQNSIGLAPTIMAYELAPRITNTRDGGWSLGTPYDDGDIWTTNLSLEDWQKKLTGYEYVMLGKADKFFWNRYGPLFENPETARASFFFEVITTNGAVMLRPISNRKPDETQP